MPHRTTLTILLATAALAGCAELPDASDPTPADGAATQELAGAYCTGLTTAACERKIEDGVAAETRAMVFAGGTSATRPVRIADGWQYARPTCVRAPATATAPAQDCTDVPGLEFATDAGWANARDQVAAGFNVVSGYDAPPTLAGVALPSMATVLRAQRKLFAVHVSTQDPRDTPVTKACGEAPYTGTPAQETQIAACVATWIARWSAPFEATARVPASHGLPAGYDAISIDEVLYDQFDGSVGSQAFTRALRDLRLKYLDRKKLIFVFAGYHVAASGDPTLAPLATFLSPNDQRDLNVKRRAFKRAFKAIGIYANLVLIETYPYKVEHLGRFEAFATNIARLEPRAVASDPPTWSERLAPKLVEFAYVDALRLGQVCTPNPVCGNRVVEWGEGCDGTAGCSATCAVVTATPVCGNGRREAGEACDDGNRVSGDGCAADCTIRALHEICYCEAARTLLRDSIRATLLLSHDGKIARGMGAYSVKRATPGLDRDISAMMASYPVVPTLPAVVPERCREYVP